MFVWVGWVVLETWEGGGGKSLILLVFCCSRTPSVSSLEATFLTLLSITEKPKNLVQLFEA